MSEQENYEAGKAAGERRVLRALRSFLDREIPQDTSYGRWLRNWIKSRTKPAKRKERANGK